MRSEIDCLVYFYKLFLSNRITSGKLFEIEGQVISHLVFLDRKNRKFLRLAN